MIVLPTKAFLTEVIVPERSRGLDRVRSRALHRNEQLERLENGGTPP
jgi:hypothetical protein